MFLNTSGIVNNRSSTNSHPGFVGWPFIGTRSRHLDVIGELDNLTTKIITLLEFFNFVSEVSRLQYE
jgi:hypothetical protein